MQIGFKVRGKSIDKYLLHVFMGMCLTVSCMQGESPLPESLHWDSPAEDSTGAIPLGNGDIGLSVWATPEGEIRGYLAKTDAWDASGGLLRLGGIALNFSPNPFGKDSGFRQTFDPARAVVTFRNAKGFEAKVWVDANQPVVRIQVSAPEEVTARFQPTIWRTEQREITGPDLQATWWYMWGSSRSNSSEIVISSPDVIADVGSQALSWYHRNEWSLWAFGFRHQNVPIPDGAKDPLLHRTFGCFVSSPEMQRVERDELVTAAPVRSLSINVSALTAIAPTPEAWLAEAKALNERIGPVTETDWQKHCEWWNAYWQRSYVVVKKAPDAAERIAATTDLPLSLGIDSEGGNGFVGLISEARVYPRALSAAEVADLSYAIPKDATAHWNFKEYSGQPLDDKISKLKAGIVGKPVSALLDGVLSARLNGKTAFRVLSNPKVDLATGGTLEMLIAPQSFPEGGSRLFDKAQVGTSTGYVFDTYPGNSLRLITMAGALAAPSCLEAGKWQRVVATFDADAQRIYVDGKLVAESQREAKRSDQPFAQRLTSAYALQRYLSACSGRGAFPIRFNGSLFWGERHFVRDAPEANPDWRMWSSDYWWQNTRLPYYPMLGSGDFDLMKPLFEMYSASLKTQEARTRSWFGCEGAFIAETATFWGMMSNGDYGFDRPSSLALGETKNELMRYYWQPGLEIAFLMLDYYDFTGDREFLTSQVFPWADSVLRFYLTRFPRDERGLLEIAPAQSLETWNDTVNPVPDVAGLGRVSERLLAMPEELVPDSLRKTCLDVRKALPPLADREADGKRVIGFAEEVRGARTNEENPELYTVFPYRVFGVGRPDLEKARNTYFARLTKTHFGWHQSGMQAACLGLRDEVASILASNLDRNNPRFRFPIMWGPHFDWVPDQCHGGNLVNTLQTALITFDGDKIYLGAGVPLDWDVDFKLHAPKRTTVTASIRQGKVTKLDVAPPERLSDVIDCLKQ